jgi:hypothetical protein
MADEMVGRCVMKFLVAILAAVVICGCASDRHKPTADYPFPKMLDPVTEEVPNVKVK